MKNKLLKYSLLGIMFACVFSLTSCEKDTEEEGAAAGLSIKVFAPTIVDAGEILAITGTDLKDVVSVTFGGGITVSNIEYIGLNQINVVVPSGITRGVIVLKTADKEVTSVAELFVAKPTISQTFPVAISTGELLTIKGTDLMCVKEVILPDNVIVPAINFNRKSVDEIRITIPSGTIDGKGEVTLVTTSGKVLSAGEIDITVVQIAPEPVEDIVIFEGSVDLGSWAGILKAPKELFANVKAGWKVVIQYKVTADNPQLKICEDNGWSGFPSTSNTSWGGTSVPNDSKEFSWAITQDDLDKIAAASNFIIQGQNAIITKIFVVVPKTILMFEGECDMGNWSNNLMIPTSELTKIAAGMTIVVEYALTGSSAQFKICPSVDWTAFEKATNTNWGGIDLPADSKEYSFVLTEKDMGRLANSTEFIIQGKNAKVKKVYAK